MSNIFDRKRAKKVNHGIVAERKFAARVGGLTRPGSGNMDGAKGDVVKDDFLIESKATIKKTFSLPLEWLCKIKGEAQKSDLSPALVVQFVDQDGRVHPDGSWVLMEESMFRRLSERDE